MLTDIISQLAPSHLIPRIHTQDGLRQFQLTVAGFVVIYTFLHLSLFMDGMVHHAYFAINVVTIVLYFFLPTDYTLRPVTILKKRLSYLVGVACLWLFQPFILPLDQKTSILFDSRRDLAIQATQTMNQLQAERVTQSGGKVDGESMGQGVYAMQMATAIKCLGWMSVLFAGLMFVEASFVWAKCVEIARNEMSSAEKEKQEAQASRSESAAHSSK
ncbi:hypothetical protein B0O80DRAFT_433761 [Mortierella sp. GBAus27b]|nr:hypothetical protein BGX31_001316 [Mortierella sp. GBA43]KAI8363476.1 hypothetical protein B0O80DRAFT_433761 [Mortierella sp. GBAus27b]